MENIKNRSSIKILGIETSCDETAIAVVQNSPLPENRILSNIIYSQIAEHAKYGGVVPELAARSHLKNIQKIFNQALQKSHIDLKDIDAIAVTSGPGLMGGLLVGVMFAKSICLATKKPYIPINHLEGHALTARLTHNVLYPYLLILASGGHCQFICVENVGKYKLLGQTLDDAAGEAFDKVAKLMNLGHPGGPLIEKMAKLGDPNFFDLPIPMRGKTGCDLSFSGLKTAVLNIINNHKDKDLDEKFQQNLAASFQKAVALSILDRLKGAMEIYKGNSQNIVFAGGVAANQTLRQHIEQFCHTQKFNFYVPPVNLCTDNAAMIAWAAIEKIQNPALTIPNIHNPPQPRWNIENQY